VNSNILYNGILYVIYVIKETMGQVKSSYQAS